MESQKVDKERKSGRLRRKDIRGNKQEERYQRKLIEGKISEETSRRKEPAGREKEEEEDGRRERRAVRKKQEEEEARVLPLARRPYRNSNPQVPKESYRPADDERDLVFPKDLRETEKRVAGKLGGDDDDVERSEKVGAMAQDLFAGLLYAVACEGRGRGVCKMDVWSV